MKSRGKPQSADALSQTNYNNETFQEDHSYVTNRQAGAYDTTGNVQQTDLRRIYSPNTFQDTHNQQDKPSLPVESTTEAQPWTSAISNHTGTHISSGISGTDGMHLQNWSQWHDEYTADLPPMCPDPLDNFSYGVLPHTWSDPNFDFNTLEVDLPGFPSPNLQLNFFSVPESAVETVDRCGEPLENAFTPLIAPFESDDERWSGTLARSRAADRSFLYGVRTTKIFCRPSCPSRRPSREHVEFFPFPNAIESAALAGFRPCKRCIPDTMGVADKGVNGVVKALRLIVSRAFEANADESPVLRLEDLAKQAGLSPFHFQRVFKANTQMTPGDFTTACQTLALQEALSWKPIDNWSSEIHAAGVGLTNVTETLKNRSHWSIRTVKKALGGIAPAEYAIGAPKVDMLHTHVECPAGPLCIAHSGKGVIHSVLLGDDAGGQLEVNFRRSTRSIVHEAALRQCIQHLKEQSKDRDVELPRDLMPIVWRARIWLKLVHDDIMG